MKPPVLHPDRALPADPSIRGIARRIYAATSSLPLVSMHGHIEAQMLADDAAFTDPARLLVVPDHYVTRMLVSQGIPLQRLGVPAAGGGPVEEDPREIWRLFCANWHLFRGTPSRFWLEHELVEVFGVATHPSAETADELYDTIADRLADPRLRPRALLGSFAMELLATTDPATSTLEHHARLAADGLTHVVPTYRPDALVHIDHPKWRSLLNRLTELADTDTSGYPGFIAALRRRRADFIAAGALATDHGHAAADATPLTEADAARIYADARDGRSTPADAAAFAAHMLFVMAEMSCEDGLVMQLHPGVLRNHNPAVHRGFGPDRGFDIPVAAEFTRGLRPLLDAFGFSPGFRLVLFTVDETVYSRELAPLAGAYPSVKLGAPWWFLDSPDGLRRFRELATDTAGFYNTVGFTDDTRAFASIPARHDLARRIDAGALGRLVAEYRLGEDEAIETAVDLAYHIPKTSYARRTGTGG